MTQTITQPVDNSITGKNIAGSVAKTFVDNIIRDIGQTVVHEVVLSVAKDISEEFSPKVLFSEIAGDFAKDMDELKPSKVLRSVILGK